MKKLLLSFMLFALTIAIKAQTNTVDENKYIYCELVGRSKLLSSKINVEVDFGQAQNFFNTKDARMRDDNGKVINFNSMVDALNYMGLLNWEFVQAYVVTSENQNVYRWLLKKKLSESDIEDLKQMIAKDKEKK